MERHDRKEIWQYIYYSFLAFFFLNILLNVDKILVKHYFSAFEAGIYSAFSTLGQGTFLVISLLAGIIFPVVAEQKERKENYFNSLKTISLISFFASIIISLILFAMPKYLLQLFFGPEYSAGFQFLGYYSLSMSAFGFIFLFSYFFLAINRFSFLYVLVAGSILEILLVGLLHANLYQVVMMFGLSQILSLIGILFLILREYDKNKLSAVNKKTTI